MLMESNELVQRIIELALIEDLGSPYRDLTTECLFGKQNIQAHARIISKHTEPLVICGLAVLPHILTRFATKVAVKSAYEDGQVLLPGQSLLTLEGEAASLLMLERVMLNFFQQLSAIATLTAKFVAAIKNTPAKILDTRKTLPGWRRLAKYAVQCGGGVNHRFGLYDAMMVKDTHIDFLGGISGALHSLPEKKVNSALVIVEVRTLAELQAVLNQGLGKVDRVLLDNMSLDLLQECVKLCRGKIATEVSGNINLQNVRAVAETGVDYISIGRLTHSAGNVDLSMQCEN